MKTEEQEGSSNGKRIYEYTDKGRLNYYYNEKTPNNKTYYEYDNLGNCIHYKKTEIKSWTIPNMIWTRGSKLLQYDNAGSEGNTVAKYAYDSRGVRYEKNVGGVVTKYTYDGGKLLSEMRVPGSGEIMYVSPTLEFSYDEDGIKGFSRYEENRHVYYYYVKDAIGNVVSLLKFGESVAHYEYDAWGNCKVYDTSGSGIENNDAKFIGNMNPIRWKSQYYDRESGFYAIHTANGTRYYSPEIKQYLSPVSPESMIGRATTIYGLNPYLLTAANPVNLGYNGYNIETSMPLAYDPDELSKWDLFWMPVGQAFGRAVSWYNDLHWGWKVGIGVAVIAVLAIATVATAGIAGVGIGAAFGAGFTGGAIGVGASGLAVTIASGAFAGAVIGAGIGLGAGALMGGLTSMSWQGALDGAAGGFMTGAITGAITGGIRGFSSWNSPANQARLAAYNSMDSYNVGKKHLLGAGGDWSKFSSADQTYLRALGKEAIKNTSSKQLLINSPDSFKLLYDMGRIVGTSGEMSVRLIFANLGKIITFFPV